MAERVRDGPDPGEGLACVVIGSVPAWGACGRLLADGMIVRIRRFEWLDMAFGFRWLIWLPMVVHAALAAADAPRQLMWADLVPKSSVIENPFARLTHDQLTALAEVAAVRDRKARGDKTLTPAELAGEQATARKLQQQGLDVEALLAKRKEIAEQKRGQLQAVNAGLEGQTVKLPGYMLPLDITGKKVSEFLLVPWVGACIHTPPPPPNQIVHVIPDSPFEMPGMFAPVWVTGRMSTAASKKSLFLIDGTSEIDIGYTLRASRVEVYQQ